MAKTYMPCVHTYTEHTYTCAQTTREEATMTHVSLVTSVEHHQGQLLPGPQASNPFGMKAYGCLGNSQGNALVQTRIRRRGHG